MGKFVTLLSIRRSRRRGGGRGRRGGVEEEEEERQAKKEARELEWRKRGNVRRSGS